MITQQKKPDIRKISNNAPFYYKIMHMCAYSYDTTNNYS